MTSAGIRAVEGEELTRINIVVSIQYLKDNLLFGVCNKECTILA